MTALNRREGKPAKDVSSLPQYMDIASAAELFGLSFWTLRDFVHAGFIPAVKLPHPTKPGQYLRRIWVEVCAVRAFLEKNTVSRLKELQK